MMISRALNYINIFSEDYSDATASFNDLELHQQLLTLFATAVAWTISLPLLGVGGYAVFRGLSSYFAKTLEKYENPTADKTDSVAMQRIGGIRNGGATCYLAAVLQAISAVPSYVAAFNKPLIQKAGESADAFQKKQQVQAEAHEIMTAINQGKVMTKKGINDFRKLCASLGIVPEKGEFSAPEVLKRLLDLIDYQSPAALQLESAFILPATEPERIENVRNPDAFSTREELLQKRCADLELTLNPYLVQGNNISLQTLVNQFYEGQEVASLTFKEENDGETACYHYENVERSQHMVLGGPYPDVIQVNVIQIDEQHIKLQHPQILYPAGTVQEGPGYRLVAIIEHRPGHYVTYRAGDQDALILANDATVSETKNTAIAGETYLYQLIS